MAPFQKSIYFLFLVKIFELIEANPSSTQDSNDSDEKNRTQDSNPEIIDDSNANNAVCRIDACESMASLEKGSIAELGRRILSLEQPLWKHSTDNHRWSACSEGPCRCSPQSVTINCWRMSLDMIPQRQTIPMDTAYLDLGSNKIASIHRHTFRGLTRLVQLDLSDNSLDYLPENLFENLESLKYLHLHRNSLDSLSPNLFKDLKSLETLDISENKLTSLSPSIWKGVNSLKILQLSRNDLKSWEYVTGRGGRGGLQSLEELDLTGNALTKVQSLRPLRKLQSVKLGENLLSILEPDLFHGMSNLGTLSLNQNRIELLPPKLFGDLKNVTNLDLSDNRIAQVSQEIFEGLSSLTDLNIGKNALSFIANGTFSTMPLLSRLSLHANNLESVGQDALAGLGNLTWLLLGNNILQAIDVQLFIPVPKLTRLELNNNDLLTFPEESLEHLKHLEFIKLGTNSWYCDCNITYLANWVLDHSRLVSDPKPKCNSPIPLEGRPLHEVTFNDVCEL